jgi:hypothetical protein
METTANNYYIYVFTDPSKKYEFKYGDLEFDYEPFYVGVSNKETYYKREDVHIKYAKIKKDVTNNKYKMNIINKILKSGIEPFVYKLYEDSSKEFAFNMEKYLISLIGNRYNKTGPLVNISLGGEGGDTFTTNPRKEEIREKHRLNALGRNNNMYGLSLEKRPSHIAKLKGCHWNLGRVASGETKKLFSEKYSGSKNPRSKKTLLFDKDFNFVKEFDYCFSISDYLGVSNKSVSKTALTNSKKDIPYHTTKGHFIIYKDDWDNKFKNRENEIREFLRIFKKNRNQFS